jgi:hypothetical protein
VSFGSKLLAFLGTISIPIIRAVMQVIFKQMTWLIAQEDFINVSLCESYTSYINMEISALLFCIHLRNGSQDKKWVVYHTLKLRLMIKSIQMNCQISSYLKGQKL